jgi:hypothetical protein
MALVAEALPSITCCPLSTHLLQYRGLEHVGSTQPLLRTHSWRRPGPGICTDTAAFGLSRSIVSRPRCASQEMIPCRSVPALSGSKSQSSNEKAPNLDHAHFFQLGTATANPSRPRTWAYKSNWEWKQIPNEELWISHPLGRSVSCNVGDATNWITLERTVAETV